eukprot:364180-Chlamydomonas_euryale.AAC.14
MSVRVREQGADPTWECLCQARQALGDGAAEHCKNVIHVVFRKSHFCVRRVWSRLGKCVQKAREVSHPCLAQLHAQQ